MALTTKRLFKISKSAPLFQNPERKRGSCQFTAHNPLWLSARGCNHLSLEGTKGCWLLGTNTHLPATLWPIICIVRLLRGFKQQPGVTLERERVSCGGSTPTRRHAQLQQGIWEALEKDCSAIHISTGCPVGPCRARRKDQVAPCACSLLCAHQLFQNNSSTKLSPMFTKAVGRQEPGFCWATCQVQYVAFSFRISVLCRRISANGTRERKIGKLLSVINSTLM